MPRDRLKWLSRTLAVFLVAGACRSAASVVLDLPPSKPAEGDAPAAGAAAQTGALLGGEPMPQDTARPPIEGTLDPDSVLALLPRDAGGYIDWVAAAREGVVRPRRSLPGRAEPPRGDGFGFDFFMKGPDPLFDALFTHSSHVVWLDCQGCHPTIFRYRAEPSDMKAIGSGESCGVCHGSVAFPTAACFKCHPAMPPSGEVTAKLESDIVFRRDSAAGLASFPPSVFSHWVHRIRYTCATCHPDPFEMRAGATAISMDAIQQGEQCGLCHNGRAAFSLSECTRCHVTRQDP